MGHFFSPCPLLPASFLRSKLTTVHCTCTLFTMYNILPLSLLYIDGPQILAFCQRFPLCLPVYLVCYMAAELFLKKPSVYSSR